MTTSRQPGSLAGLAAAGGALAAPGRPPAAMPIATRRRYRPLWPSEQPAIAETLLEIVHRQDAEIAGLRQSLARHAIADMFRRVTITTAPAAVNAADLRSWS